MTMLASVVLTMRGDERPNDRSLVVPATRKRRIEEDWEVLRP